MRKGFLAANVGLAPFRPGDPLLETERIARHDYLPFLESGKQPDGGVLADFFKPDKDEFKALSKGLKFLKFDEDEAQELYDLIGGTIKLATSVVSVIGAVGTVAELAKQFGLFGSKEQTTEQRLQAIGERIEMIYGYLASAERRGLYRESLGWRIANEGARDEQWNVRLSRSQTNLDALKRRASALDDALRAMLDPGSAEIAFQRAAYGYAANADHWIDAAGSPIMTRADGGAVAYSSPKQELQATIWDAGHYIDVLFAALRERLIIATALEPAFRSTGYDRRVLADIADGLRSFIAKWRASLLVANPAAGINGGKALLNPFARQGFAAYGILIGAVDPVTGISSIQTFNGFKIEFERTSFPGSAWGGTWDTSRAVEPEAALAAAASAHAAQVDAVIRACGIHSLARLESQFRTAASPPTESQFVRLPDASFRYVLPNWPIVTGAAGTPETIDLGDLKEFASDPEKTYPAVRFRRQMEKTFRFRMARRAEMSRIQLGYRLQIADRDVALCPFSTRPPEGAPGEPFPTEPIEFTHTFETDVYDCCQIRHFSANDEDRFEREGENGERVFHNMRRGKASIRVSVQFEPLAGGAADAHAGEAIVTIRNLEPDAYPDAFILEAKVFETSIDYDGGPIEYGADWMTIHMTPSYLIVGRDFFDDRWDALVRMLQTIKGLNDKYALEDLTPGPMQTEPDPDPAWGLRREALEINSGLAYIEAARRLRPELVTEQINHFRPPLMR